MIQNLKNLSVLLLCLVHCFWAREIPQDLFTNYKVIEVGNLKGIESERKFFSQIGLPEDDGLEIVHEDAVNGTIQILIKPELVEEFLKRAEESRFSTEVLIENVEYLIRSSELLRSDVKKLGGEVTFDRYMNFDEIEKYLQSLAKYNKNKVRLSSIGKSYENNTLHMVSISDFKSTTSTEAKPIIFVEAGIHAREWISPASALYLIDNLLKTPKLRSEYEWRIVPVINPDGYKYSWTRNRLWRKSRNINRYAHCFGVDLNRNFDAFWGKVGVSRNPCSGIYAGKKAFSEPETKALRDAVLADKHRVEAYISIHSYGQYILYPPAVNFYEMDSKKSSLLNSVASKMSSNIQKKTGAKYTFGTPAKLLYSAAGISIDWALVTAKIPVAFTFELRDKGKTGFLLPAARIRPTGEDFLAAMKSLHSNLLQNKNAISIRDSQIETVASSVSKLQQEQTLSERETANLRDNSAAIGHDVQISTGALRTDDVPKIPEVNHHQGSLNAENLHQVSSDAEKFEFSSNAEKSEVSSSSEEFEFSSNAEKLELSSKVKDLRQMLSKNKDVNESNESSMSSEE